MLKQLEEAILHHSSGTAQTGQHQLQLEAYFSFLPVQPSCEFIAPAKPAPFHQQHLKKHLPNHLCLLLNHFQLTEPQNILRGSSSGCRSSSLPSFLKLTGACTPCTSQTHSPGFREQPNTLPLQSCPALHMTGGINVKQGPQAHISRLSQDRFVVVRHRNPPSAPARSHTLPAPQTLCFSSPLPTNRPQDVKILLSWS